MRVVALPGDDVDADPFAQLEAGPRLNLGETQKWTVQRQGSTLTAYVYARWDPPAGQGPTGIRIAAPTTCSVTDQGEAANCQLLYPYTEKVQYLWPWQSLPKSISTLGEIVPEAVQVQLHLLPGLAGDLTLGELVTMLGRRAEARRHQGMAYEARDLRIAALREYQAWAALDPKNSEAEIEVAETVDRAGVVEHVRKRLSTESGQS